MHYCVGLRDHGFLFWCLDFGATCSTSRPGDLEIYKETQDQYSMDTIRSLSVVDFGTRAAARPEHAGRGLKSLN